MLTLVRYYSFDAPPDVDPLTTQPAADAYGTLLSSKTGYALVNAWVVDAEGRKVSPPPPVEFDLGIFTLSSTEADRPAGASGSGVARNELWGRGLVSAAITPAGIWQIQTELGSTLSFTALVTAVTTAAPGFFLAIYADLDARGPRRGDV
jgi:hypothetical protein